MKGAPGTNVKLTIVRPGRDKPFDVAVVRERIELRPVKWEIKDGIGIININTFAGNTGDATKAALLAIDKATGGKPLGYVVDLRSNPGGLLDQAIDVSDAFLERGEIVSQRGREKDDIERYYATPGDMAHGLPVVVLIDAGSASAAEIVAGALQDHHRALVMGERSFGKGSVQTRPDHGPEGGAAADHGALLHAVGPLGSGRRHRSRHHRAAADRSRLTRTARSSARRIFAATCSARPRSTTSCSRKTISRRIRASTSRPPSSRRRASRTSSSTMR